MPLSVSASFPVPPVSRSAWGREGCRHRQRVAPPRSWVGAWAFSDAGIRRVPSMRRAGNPPGRVVDSGPCRLSCGLSGPTLLRALHRVPTRGTTLCKAHTRLGTHRTKHRIQRLHALPVFRGIGDNASTLVRFATLRTVFAGFRRILIAYARSKKRHLPLPTRLRLLKVKVQPYQARTGG